MPGDNASGAVILLLPDLRALVKYWCSVVSGTEALVHKTPGSAIYSSTRYSSTYNQTYSSIVYSQIVREIHEGIHFIVFIYSYYNLINLSDLILFNMPQSPFDFKMNESTIIRSNYRQVSLPNFVICQYILFRNIDLLFI